MRKQVNYVNEIYLCKNDNNVRKYDYRHGNSNSGFLLSQAGTRKRSLEEVVLKISQRERPFGEYRQKLYSFSTKFRERELRKK